MIHTMVDVQNVVTAHIVQVLVYLVHDVGKKCQILYFQ